MGPLMPSVTVTGLVGWLKRWEPVTLSRPGTFTRIAHRISLPVRKLWTGRTMRLEYDWLAGKIAAMIVLTSRGMELCKPRLVELHQEAATSAIEEK